MKDYQVVFSNGAKFIFSDYREYDEIMASLKQDKTEKKTMTIMYQTGVFTIPLYTIDKIEKRGSKVNN